MVADVGYEYSNDYGYVSQGAGRWVRYLCLVHTFRSETAEGLFICSTAVQSAGRDAYEKPSLFPKLTS